MKALVKPRPGPCALELADWPEPVCGPQQVKIEVSGCGICGTDLLVREDKYKNFPPVVLGHEFAGTVADVGADVRGFVPGQKVAILPSSAITCGLCLACRRGEYMFCAERRGMGHGTSGGLTRFVTVKPTQVFALPDGVDLDTAAMAEPFACAVHAVLEIGKPVVGDVALVSGPGSIGLMILKLLVASGVRAIVTGTERDVDRLELAKKLGATAAINVERTPPDDVIRALTDGRGVDIAFEVAGAGASVRACLAALRRAGRFVQVGVCGREVEIVWDQLLLKQVELLGSLAHTETTWHRVMRIFGQQSVRVDDLITHKLPLDRWEEAFALVESKQGVKVMLVPS